MIQWIPIVELILSFISCVTFCYACYLNLKMVHIMKKDKKANKLRQMVDSHVLKELKRKEAEEENDPVHPLSEV